jgi:hypothetical protein
MIRFLFNAFFQFKQLSSQPQMNLYVDKYRNRIKKGHIANRLPKFSKHFGADSQKLTGIRESARESYQNGQLELSSHIDRRERTCNAHGGSCPALTLKLQVNIESQSYVPYVHHIDQRRSVSRLRRAPKKL